MDVIEFGNFIKERRVDKGLTQKQLADLISVTDKAVSRWENGHGFPDIESLEPLANALDLSLWEIMHSRLDDREMLSRSDVDAILADAIDISVKNILKAKRKRAFLIVLSAILFVILVLLLVFSGVGVSV